MQKSRDVYSPVAYRASILYFVVKDLQKVNSMYQFSLTWFKQIFVKSLELSNVTRDDPGAVGSDDDDNSLALLNNTFSLDDRIDLIIKTFT